MAIALNPYRPIRTRVTEVIPETPTIKTFRLQPEEPLAFAAGQFIALTVPGVGEAPFTPSSSASMSKQMDVTIMRVGRVTERIHALAPGDTVGLRGPFGRGYPLDEFDDKEVLVVGGGCGFAPIRSLMYALFERIERFKKLCFRGGCRHPKEVLYRQELNAWAQRSDLDFALTVDEPDEGWEGHVGVVTTILDELDLNCSESIAIVCGPPTMMKFAVQKLLNLGFQDTNLYLSMEQNMSCGFGVCGHCRIGQYYTCADGPVFSYEKVRDVPNLFA